MCNLDARIRNAVETLREADALLITAGAGMGVDSGLPDFRGDHGFWRAYPKLAELNRSFVDMANARAFQESPELAWAFYGHRLHLYRATQPHHGFGLLSEYGQSRQHGYFVFTSNVDGQFQKAGFTEDRIVEYHGSIHHLQCAQPCGPHLWSAQGMQVAIDEPAFIAKKPLPVCPGCGGLARPNVLMFGDGRWIADRTEAQMERMDAWVTSVIHRKARLVIIEVGAGTALPSVRSLSERIARNTGGTLIRINPREAEVPDGQLSLPLGALAGIRAITGLTAQ
jgi:NAD-dependent SIR2 family protein deacetylase